MFRTLVVAATLLAASPAFAQTAPQHPVKIPAPGGEVIIPNARSQQSYDNIKYAPARRAGDTVYVSGVIIAPAPDEPKDVVGLKASARRAFKAVDELLKAAGGSWDDVVMVNSFHVWESPNFTGTRMDHVTVMNEVRGEFTQAPHPAWTAVGTSGLLAPTGVIEMQVIAHIPQKK
ncbi:Rid family hydrolase [Caulobacter segnis]|uniref:Rid family hydrolase n=1 Tax=Caulobacter segnis TaxID=88688 RepID=UPI00240F4534|nr:Rid family hydrolase [Caulobacter segnis]MDG2523125.1 Rid family hydrolase [Caulobacter segnis]